jgi:asparagine synthase (glutamine-hydrolysing)
MVQKQYQYYNHLGAFCPYYFLDKNGNFQIDAHLLQILKKSHIPSNLDKVAISEVLNNRFMLGDRTIIENIQRRPWMARPNSDNNVWEYFQFNKHEELKQDGKLIADRFFDLICKEIKEYIGKKKKIGVLLSGGMDSRIVAGCLDYLIKTDQVVSTSVTAYTWGHSESRDVVYAKIIAGRLNWKWKHYQVGAEELWENFKESGHRGAEYSGLHLHAIPQIKRDMDVDLMLVGSFGDSIGRAEFSGIKVDNLSSIENGFRNFKGFIQNKKFNQLKNKWKSDIHKYHVLFPENKQYQQYELDYQLHYMRRMLNSCMEILNEKAPTYQVFTAPEVYQFIWSLDPSCRTDEIYSLLMIKFQTKLNDIPWARTGVPYLKKGNPDSFTKGHHSYSYIIQSQLLDKIEERALSERIIGLNLFNIEAIRNIFKLIKLRPDYNFDYLERLTWLVSLDFFLEKINNIDIEENIKNNIHDILTAYLKEPVRYLALNVFRRFN